MMRSEDLLTDVLTRDPVAWRKLVAQHEPALRRTIRNIDDERAISDDEVDDVLGDLWLLLLEDDLRRLRGFHSAGGSNLGAWLTLVAVEVARKELRRRARLPEVVSFDATTENRIALALIRELDQRGILGPHDQAVASAGTAKEAIECRHDKLRPAFAGQHGSRAVNDGGSSSSRRARAKTIANQLLDGFARKSTNSRSTPKKSSRRASHG
jgi:DNA-directed RNA polymerase specialized sigma24 family protein